MKRTMYEAAHHTPKRKAVRSNRAGDATPAVRKSRTAGFFFILKFCVRACRGHFLPTLPNSEQSPPCFGLFFINI